MDNPRTPESNKKTGAHHRTPVDLIKLATIHNFNTIAYPYLKLAYPYGIFAYPKIKNAYPRGILNTPYSLSIELPNIVLNCFISFLITEDNKSQL